MPQIPSVAPVSFVQMPPQQSVSLEQASPVWVQNETLAEQTPFEQTEEQQSELLLQVLPEVLQPVFSGMQTLPPPSPPAAQLPPQHSALLEHGLLSEVQSFEPHLPPVHTSVQQSVGDEHAWPAVLHDPMGSAQTLSFGSQLAEQQSPLEAQPRPLPLQLPLAPPVPALPPLPPPPPLPAAPADPSVPASFFLFPDLPLLPHATASASATAPAPRSPNHSTRMPHLAISGESGHAHLIMKQGNFRGCWTYMDADVAPARIRQDAKPTALQG